MVKKAKKKVKKSQRSLTRREVEQRMAYMRGLIAATEEQNAWLRANPQPFR